MFRKLVSNLPFSPALVGQLGFYARRLSNEQTMRRLGLVFTVLAIAVQTFAIIKPPEPTIAAAPSSSCIFDAALERDDANCQACPYNSTIWVKDTNCEPTIKLVSDAINLSQSGAAATKTTAQPGDRVQYNLHTTNTGSAGNTIAIQTNISDLLEYATVIDLGGGNLDAKSKNLQWGATTLAPSQTDVRSFVVEINSVIPATPQAVDNPQSYDCTLTSVYGNALNIHLACPIGKVVENTVRQLPTTNALVVLLFSTVLLGTSIYFYARSKQLGRELRLIRRHYNVGPF